ncbi:Protein of unknown function (DUF3122) [Rivularia sp. PCC 7116]|uniref:DUF3122 domain-containing protein n=1 Tax=Rivularia sp. PCC 7116 TaxID=373994 RepID=UPI00029F2CD8|nr:DUF3122 domain-containing protein [Rivularia sp. PCC 7116]AFY56125.1 Protein of unknown function (DUF3122) [Rivularia sp. PCC 7116]
MFTNLLRRCFTIIILIFIAIGFTSQESIAMLRQHHDAPGVLRYHSQVSIKDKQEYTWQVLLFKKINPGVKQELNLRIVGFPGVFEFFHPHSLEIITASGKFLNASDVYANSSPAPNVGEYSLTDVLPKLTEVESLKLNLPVSGKEQKVLEIPEEVVTEWQLLVTEVD